MAQHLSRSQWPGRGEVGSRRSASGSPRQASGDETLASTVTDLQAASLASVLAGTGFLNVQLQHGIGEGNVHALTELLLAAPGRVRCLAFSLLDGLPAQALQGLLQAVDALPALEQLDILGFDEVPPAELDERRFAWAASGACVRQCLGVRPYLLREPDWVQWDHTGWQSFFERLDFLDLSQWSDAEGLRNFEAQARCMAVVALKHHEGPLIRALMAVFPGLHLVLTDMVLSKKQIRLLARLQIDVHIELVVTQARQLTLAARLLRKPSVRVRELLLKFGAGPESPDMGKVYPAILNAVHLNTIVLNLRRGTVVKWPRAALARRKAATQPERLNLNAGLFGMRYGCAGRFIRALAPIELCWRIFNPRELKLIASLRGVPPGVVCLDLRMDGFVPRSDQMYAELQQSLREMLDHGHQLQTIRMHASFVPSDPEADWPAWVAMAKAYPSLREVEVYLSKPNLSRPVRFRWCLQEALMIDPMLERFYRARALGGTKGFFNSQRNGLGDVSVRLVEQEWLSLRDQVSLSSLERVTHQAARAERRRAQLAELPPLRHQAPWAWVEQRLSLLVDSGAGTGPDLELLRQLKRVLENSGASAQELAVVDALLASG